VSFLLHVSGTEDGNDEPVFEETIFCDIDVLFGFEKEMTVLGRTLALKFEFDPPLRVEHWEPD
jgi:hypothetical protein